MSDQAIKNTDREIWRGKSRATCEDDDRYYADSMFVPAGDVEALGINCGGMVIVKPVREWHRLAAPSAGERVVALRGLSEKATPGEWIRSKHCFQIVTADEMHSVTELQCPRGLAKYPAPERIAQHQADVTFMVACVNYVRAALAIPSAAPPVTHSDGQQHGDRIKESKGGQRRESKS